MTVTVRVTVGDEVVPAGAVACVVRSPEVSAAAGGPCRGRGRAGPVRADCRPRGGAARGCGDDGDVCCEVDRRGGCRSARSGRSDRTVAAGGRGGRGAGGRRAGCRCAVAGRRRARRTARHGGGCSPVRAGGRRGGGARRSGGVRGPVRAGGGVTVAPSGAVASVARRAGRRERGGAAGSGGDDCCVGREGDVRGGCRAERSRTARRAVLAGRGALVAPRVAEASDDPICAGRRCGDGTEGGYDRCGEVRRCDHRVGERGREAQRHAGRQEQRGRLGDDDRGGVLHDRGERLAGPGLSVGPGKRSGGGSGG